MPQSLSRVIVHLTFATQHRAPMLEKDVRDELHPYLVGILRNLKCTPIQVGGVEDHVHALFALSRTLTQAKAAEMLKGPSSVWIKEKWPRLKHFSWQAGYAIFSVGPREVDGVVRYIQNQEEHHRRVDFKVEYIEMLQMAGLRYDEQYLWD